MNLEGKTMSSIQIRQFLYFYMAQVILIDSAPLNQLVSVCDRISHQFVVEFPTCMKQL